MGFVKGMITGVLAVAGVFVGAAVVSLIKDEKKENAEISGEGIESNKLYFAFCLKTEPPIYLRL